MVLFLLSHWLGAPARLQCHLLASVCIKHFSKTSYLAEHGAVVAHIICSIPPFFLPGDGLLLLELLGDGGDHPLVHLVLLHVHLELLHAWLGSSPLFYLWGS